VFVFRDGGTGAFEATVNIELFAVAVLPEVRKLTPQLLSLVPA
jgi:hypothetical protein